MRAEELRGLRSSYRSCTVLQFRTFDIDDDLRICAEGLDAFFSNMRFDSHAHKILSDPRHYVNCLDDSRTIFCSRNSLGSHGVFSTCEKKICVEIA